MSRWFLSKVIAGAALGCAALLAAAPASAMADEDHKQHKDGWIYTVPEPTKAGHLAYIVQICKEEQKHAWIWSELTGKLKLEPQPFDKGKHYFEKHGKGKHYFEKDGKGKHYFEEDGKGKHFFEEDGKHGEEGEEHHPFAYWVLVDLSYDIEPGAYKLKGSCAKGELVVAPAGWVDGGDGGLTAGSNAGLAAGGAGMVAAATLGGLALMRRRAANGTVA